MVPSLLVVAIVINTAAVLVHALPHPDDPVDPSKRAPISTKDAVRPAATTPAGSGIVGDGKIPEKHASIQVASTDKSRAPIVVSETKKKSVTKPAERGVKVRRDFNSRHVSRLPSSIPRLDRERFGKTLAEYRQGKVPPSNLANLKVRVGKETVDMAEINRYANPRAALEAQGIPVTSAASGTAPEGTPAVVPVTQEHTAKSE